MQNGFYDFAITLNFENKHYIVIDDFERIVEMVDNNPKKPLEPVFNHNGINRTYLKEKYDFGFSFRYDSICFYSV